MALTKGNKMNTLNTIFIDEMRGQTDFGDYTGAWGTLAFVLNNEEGISTIDLIEETYASLGYVYYGMLGAFSRCKDELLAQADMDYSNSQDIRDSLYFDGIFLAHQVKQRPFKR
jgi:hypothetical protein